MLTIKQVSSANNLGVEEVLLTMSFLQTRNDSGPNVDACETP